jgi:2',3'-cyclic-nucleotide 2'-phosphodiesterase (5'-nucleotidase family)
MYKKCTRTLFLIVAAIICITCVSTPVRDDKSNEFRLTILHTNDLHGRLENVPRYSTIVKQIRDEGGNVLLLDGGDLYRRGPYERFNGAVETEIFNTMKYDAIVFGNGDFPANDKELYNVSEHTILKMAKFPVLCGNVTINGNYIEGFEPYIIKNIQGVDVAIIGVTSLKPRRWNFDLTKRALFDAPVQSLDKLVVETKEKSDIQIALSHAGFPTDQNIKTVSAIISADTHIKITPPYVSLGKDYLIPIVQAGGEEDNYLGRLDLVYKKEKGQWILKEFNSILFSLENVAEDIEIRNILDKYNEQLRGK